MNPDFRKVALIAAVLGLIVSLYIALSGDDASAASMSLAHRGAPGSVVETLPVAGRLAVWLRERRNRRPRDDDGS